MVDEVTSRTEHHRRVWATVNEQFTDRDAEARWRESELRWGLFRSPESVVGVIGDPRGLDIVELGCGTAFVSAALARSGARPVAVDLSAEQLDTARRCQARFGVRFPLAEADVEEVPLRTGSFDLAVSEYGAAPWCEPGRWLAEAARLLRPGGRLVFLTNSVLAGLCVPDEGLAGIRLQRPQRDLRRVEWDGGGTEHHPGHGEWIAALRAAGFTVEALHEMYADDDAETPAYYDIVTAGWARRWPAEDLWVARR